MTTDVATYLSEGCGRCSLGGTPECKVHTWQQELTELRRIVLECGLDEECKWGVPCYTFQGKNIIMVSALKDGAIISFFKGSLLQDEPGLLSFAGENSQVAKIARFTRAEEILKVEELLKTYIFEAVEVEKAGLKVQKSTAPELPKELLRKFGEMPAFREAFEALTPGRQRGYLLHFSQPKQSATRTTRIEKCLPKIFAGKGMQE
ncbi:MAG TPA: YdeI/OmpD-associated family protein [Saprospiraceae bacterium]|nr:YdeI/OmpD-associated family protein [Saprospiraceae bacterium]